jgi:hypothetical protein
MGNVSPDPAELALLRADAPTGPVLIVNLIRFKPGADAVAAYRRYLESARDDSRPVEVIHAGPAYADTCDNAEQWDYVIIARYPSFNDFADLVTHPNWQGHAAAHRPEAVERTIMLVTSAGPLPSRT